MTFRRKVGLRPSSGMSRFPQTSTTHPIRTIFLDGVRSGQSDRRTSMKFFNRLKNLPKSSD